ARRMDPDGERARCRHQGDDLPAGRARHRAVARDLRRGRRGTPRSWLAPRERRTDQRAPGGDGHREGDPKSSVKDPARRPEWPGFANGDSRRDVMSPKNPANGAPTCEARVLVVEDDEAMRVMLDEELREAGYDVVTAAGGEEALELISTWSVDVVVTDQMMPGMKGRELLSEIQSRNPRLPVVITTAFGTIESAVDAIKAGAFHYVAKPFRVEQLLAAVSSALRERHQLEELVDYRETFGETPRIVAESSAMKAAIDMILRAAPAATPVLLLGQGGTGKEL